MLSSALLLSQNESDSKTSKKKSSITNKGKSLQLNGKDGPYIIGDTLFVVTAENKLIGTPRFRRDSLVVRVDNSHDDEFYLTLHKDYEVPKSVHKESEKMIVISDIEGNFNAFSSFLYANKVIDEEHNWIYGNGKLVLVGDFVDRGKNVTQVLWLIYNLDHQAKKAGGMVHFILGNHEVMNFHGDFRYNLGKYIRVAQDISRQGDEKEAIKYLYSKNSELGKWLASKNIIEKIGDYLFVHAGLSPELLAFKLSLKDINAKVRKQYFGFEDNLDKSTQFLYGRLGPFWYRGLVTSTKRYSQIDEDQLDDLLDYYDAKKIVIGHTVVKTISSDFDGKIIRTDVKHGDKKFSGKTQGLLIEDGDEYIVDAKGSKTELED
ncbi:metallophosphoesterase [Winogradskyella maritima]|uniref:Metallophosphoesterase n=1 Tax=Winogradskyella maritima TaxID=1517766 RepID=A0ABV8ALB9_9FLAO|nr:metallophosphoesterase [Winogradskyella maritima]